VRVGFRRKERYRDGRRGQPFFLIIGDSRTPSVEKKKKGRGKSLVSERGRGKERAGDHGSGGEREKRDKKERGTRSPILNARKRKRRKRSRSLQRKEGEGMGDFLHHYGMRGEKLRAFQLLSEVKKELSNSTGSTLQEERKEGEMRTLSVVSVPKKGERSKTLPPSTVTEGRKRSKTNSLSLRE